MPDEKFVEHYKNLKKIGFEIMIVSNNHMPRIKAFADVLGISYVYRAKKPLKWGLKKALKKTSYKPSEVVFIGDQLMTDVFGAKRMKFYVCTVDAIKRKTEKWYTKLNRRLEAKMLLKIEKKHKETFENLKLEEKKWLYGR